MLSYKLNEQQETWYVEDETFAATLKAMAKVVKRLEKRDFFILHAYVHHLVDDEGTHFQGLIIAEA